MSSVQSREISPEINKFKPGLIYDADGIALLGKYTDELSAHRAKKHWVDVLNSYFLLEKDRDYELWVTTSLQESYFVLNCSFISACGRYTFWRLINHQAPEAERKLGSSFDSATIRRMNSEDEEDGGTWVFSALDQQIDESQHSITLLEKIKKLFQ